MTFKKIVTVASLVTITFTLSACLKVNSGVNKEVRPDSGFFASVDKGATWVQKTALLSTGGVAKNFSLESVASMEIDPSDPKTIYFGTVGQGMLYTFDRGASWQVALTLGPGTVSAIAVDPSNKCLVYAAIGNRLHRTNDCLRTWKTVFTDTADNIQLSSVNIDHFNPKNIYITLSRGDLVKSGNNGDSWQTIYRFGSKVKKFAIDPSDSRRMYADVSKDGLSFSDDSGAKWTSMKAVLDEYKISGEIVDIELLKEQAGLVYLATEKGIVKSEDRGKTWKQLALIPPANNASIASIAINPKNPNEIFYVGASVLYKSIDGGNNWATKPLPTSRNAKIIIIDNVNPENIYLGLGK